MYIKVKVKAGQKKEEFEPKNNPASHKASTGYGDTFLVSVKEKAERNMANKRILELVARHFKLPVGKVRIINGHTSPSKLLSIDI